MLSEVEAYNLSTSLLSLSKHKSVVSKYCNKTAQIL